LTEAKRKRTKKSEESEREKQAYQKRQTAKNERRGFVRLFFMFLDDWISGAAVSVAFG
jgi:hypothetical protein